MTFPTRTARRSRAGFTLVEIMIVIVLAGTLMALGLPKLDYTKYRADAAVQNLRTVLMQAQRTALLRQYDVVISIDTVHNALKWAEDANNDGTIQATEHIRTYPMSDMVVFYKAPVGIDGVVAPSVSGSSMGTLNSLPTITFHRDGAASSDVTLYIAGPAYPGRTYRAVRLTQSTARTDWYRFNVAANTWQIAGLQ
jgi:prepilin-type N-terminal cleavage/methylation domain-containing protein